jgi:hypothetical protein
MFLIELYRIFTEFLEQLYPGLNKDFYKNDDDLDCEVEFLFQKNAHNKKNTY